MRPLVVVGDSMLDVDLVGRAGRLAPDAPAPVLDDLHELARPGGAALAATLAARSGRSVVLVTALGDDPAGARLTSLLDLGITVVRVPGGGSTPVKKRVRAGGQTLLRLDSGAEGAPLGGLPAAAAEAVGDAAAVLVSDYGRGLTGHDGVRSVLAGSRAPVVWDPHPRGGRAVPGARLVTPNTAELELLAGDAPSRRDDVLGTRGEAAARLAEAWGSDAVTVTLGEHGALLVTRDGVPSFYPAPPTSGVDTCGAGDCFAATAALRLADGALVSEAVEAAVAAAAAFVGNGAAGALGRQGAEIPSSPPAPTTGRLVATGGCFDLLHAGHVACLEAARRLGDRLVVCLNSDASVRRLKGPERPVVPEADRVRVLEALACVDEVVVFDEDTPVEVLRRLRPDIWAKGGDYDAASLPETPVLAEWGGRAVVLPYLTGRSTTDLVRSVRTREGSTR